MAIAPERIERATDFQLPEERMLEEVFGALSEEGAKEFSGEIVRAIGIARSTGDLRPVQNVLLAWFRTLRFVRKPGFAESLAQADGLLARGLDEGLDLESLRDELAR